MLLAEVQNPICPSASVPSSTPHLGKLRLAPAWGQHSAPNPRGLSICGVASFPADGRVSARQGACVGLAGVHGVLELLPLCWAPNERTAAPFSVLLLTLCPPSVRCPWDEVNDYHPLSSHGSPGVWGAEKTPESPRRAFKVLHKPLAAHKASPRTS